MNEYLANSILMLLRPLIGLMNRNGIAFGEFSRLAKLAYVQETEKELIKHGQKATTSKISIVTGLTRKDIAALRKEDSPVIAQDYQKNRAVRVISGWISDSRFCNEEGEAKILSIQGGGDSFETLVNFYSGDIPYNSMLEELIRIGSVERIKKDKVVLVQGVYIPSGEDVGKYELLGEDVSLLISTMKHNILLEDEPPYYQRKVCYDHVPAEYLDEFRALANESNQALLVKLNEWLSRHDIDRNPSLKTDKPMKVGVGVYYFEKEAKINKDEKNEA